MKVLLIHGDDTYNSYKYLCELIKTSKKKNWQIIKIDPKKKEKLSDNIAQNSLFEKKRLFILENYKSLGKADLKWIKDKLEDTQGYLVIYERGKIQAGFIKAVEKSKKEKTFELPSVVFKFLDAFYPGNGKEALNLLHLVKKRQPVEFLFTMLSRHLKDLYWVSIDPSSIPYASWRVSKLEKQAKRFPEEKIKNIIKILSDLDIKVKTTSESLEDSLDLIILQELE
ncbi:hypothetical protein ACFL0F_00040 [Patescibacteria group bacterium]